MSPRQVFSILWARKLTVLIVAVLSVAFAMGALLFVAPRYDATAQIFVNIAENDPVTSAQLPVGLARNRVHTQIETIKSRGVAALVVDKLSPTRDTTLRNERINQLLSGLDVTRVAASDLISITFRSGEAASAANFANAFAEAAVAKDIELRVTPARDLLKWYDDRIAELENTIVQSRGRLAELRRSSSLRATGERTANTLDDAASQTTLQSMSREIDALQKQHEDLLQRRERLRLESEINRTTVSILTRAAPPDAPSFPKTRLVLATALAFGLAAGLALAFLRELFDRRVRCPEDVLWEDTPLLAVVPKARLRKRPSIAGAPAARFG